MKKWKLLVLVVLTTAGISRFAIATMYEPYHFPGGVLECEWGGTTPLGLVKVIDVYFFSDAGDLTITDSSRPAYVSNEPNPWDLSLTNLDPSGGTQPYLGIHFKISNVGTYFDNDAVFWAPHEVGTEYHIGSTILTRFWNDENDGIVTDSAVAREIEEELPAGLTFPDDYQFVYDNYVIPEPSTLVLIGLTGGIALFIRRYRLY